jgi:hypothetical protein
MYFMIAVQYTKYNLNNLYIAGLCQKDHDFPRARRENDVWLNQLQILQ